MFRILVLSICITTIIASVEINPRISGGYYAYYAKKGMFKYMASVLKYGQCTCGGSIISEKYILTAAHCTAKGGPANYTVQVGSIYCNMSGVIHNVKNIINHPQYYNKDRGHSAVANDISLIAVTQVITFSATIAPIYIPRENYRVGVKGLVSGWGDTGPGSETFTLKYDYYTIKDINTCEPISKYNPLFNAAQWLCTRPPDGMGVCRGDSGGPLAYNNKVIGIVSISSEGCGSGTIYALYTNVAYYANWIEGVMQYK